MKKLLLVILAVLLILPTFSIAETVEEVEAIVGVDVETANIDVLRVLVEAIDTEFHNAINRSGGKGYYDMYRIAVSRLLEMQDHEWLLTYAISSVVHLEDMSVDQLYALRSIIDKEIRGKEESNEVIVPAGLWIVGEDIPAGKWEIHATDNAYNIVTIGDTLTEGGRSISLLGKVYIVETIIGKNNWAYDDGDPTYFSVELKNGYYVDISQAVVFRKYTGKPDLGFDWN